MKAALIICTLAALVCAGYSWHIPHIPACPRVDKPDTEAVLLPNPWNCASYFECANGHPFLMQCPTGLYYDIFLKTCNYPDRVNCGRRSRQDLQLENL